MPTDIDALLAQAKRRHESDHIVPAVHEHCGDYACRLAAALREAQQESAALAAFQCPHGYGDESGTPRCSEVERLKRELAEARRHITKMVPEEDLSAIEVERERLERELAEAHAEIEDDRRNLIVYDDEGCPVPAKEITSQRDRLRAALEKTVDLLYEWGQDDEPRFIAARRALDGEEQDDG